MVDFLEAESWSERLPTDRPLWRKCWAWCEDIFELIFGAKESHYSKWQVELGYSVIPTVHFLSLFQMIASQLAGSHASAEWGTQCPAGGWQEVTCASPSIMQWTQKPHPQVKECVLFQELSIDTCVPVRTRASLVPSTGQESSWAPPNLYLNVLLKTQYQALFYQPPMGSSKIHLLCVSGCIKCPAN